MGKGSVPSYLERVGVLGSMVALFGGEALSALLEAKQLVGPHFWLLFSCNNEPEAQMLHRIIE